MERAYCFSRTAEGRVFVAAEVPGVEWTRGLVDAFSRPLTRAEIAGDPNKLAAVAEWERGNDELVEIVQDEMDAEGAALTSDERADMYRIADGPEPSRHLRVVK